jgi:radical SAM superfamily enzyme YgiQ (UPF0313 family)
MVFRGTLDRRPAMLSVKDTSISLAFEAEWVAAWDLGGRVYSLWKNGDTYRRGLSGRMLHKPRRTADERQRLPVEGEAADAVVRELAGEADRLKRSLDRDPSGWTNSAGRHPGTDVLAVVGRCARFDAAAARGDAARFSQVYGTVGILPPDQYLSTVVQATGGCSFGTCSFCDLYADSYRVKSAGEFEAHVRSAHAFLGESARLRERSFFLGAANALAAPLARLIEFFGALPGPFGRPRPIHAFVDGFTGARKSASDYAELRRRGLGRVYVGLESGHDPLLDFIRKPATSAQAVDTVRAIKDGGASVGVIAMIGLGGRAFAAGHVRDTVAAINAMGLGDGDLLFFSELVEVPGTAYPASAAAAGIEPLQVEERLAQAEAIRAGLVFAARPPQLARYDVREFVY